MPQASLHALIVAYQSQIGWLLTQAEAFENGQRKVSGKIGGKEVDMGTLGHIRTPAYRPINISSVIIRAGLK
jgi:hypothetical protein